MARTVLGLWAHPDDETVLAGGLLADAARRGADVRCVYMTSGEAGRCAHGPTSPRALADLRARELSAALAHLGVTSHRVLGHPDGALTGVPEDDAIAAIHVELAAVDPDVVVTFGDDGFTGHPDHRCLAGWVDAAISRWDHGEATLLRPAVPTTWDAAFVAALDEFDVFWPGHPLAIPPAETDLHLALDDELLERKVAALRAHASQLRPLFDAYGTPFIRALSSAERFRRVRVSDRSRVTSG